MIPKKTERSPLTSNGQTNHLYSNNIIIITTTTTALIFYLATEINCCVVNPRESLTTVGEVVLLGCNARPNNEQRGTVSNLKLENEDKSEALIFQAPVYNAKGEISTEQFVADGYFLSTLDDDLVNATIQINETQLKHGGRYVCGCTSSTISTGSANLVVLADKLSFVLNGRNPPTTPGELLDLSCTLSFNGSLSSVSVDLTINDANGTQLAAKLNLSLTRSEGSHHINYSFIAHGNKDQNFTCEMKAWNQSSSEKRLLHSVTSHFSLNPDSWSGATQATASTVSVGLAVGVLVLVASVVVFVIYRTRGKLCTGKSDSRNLEPRKNSRTTQQQHSRYVDGKPSIDHPKAGSCSSEDKKQQNRTRTDNEVVVVDNDIYDASSSDLFFGLESQNQNRAALSRNMCSSDADKEEQIYQEIL